MLVLAASLVLLLGVLKVRELNNLARAGIPVGRTLRIPRNEGIAKAWLSFLAETVIEPNHRKDIEPDLTRSKFVQFSRSPFEWNGHAIFARALRNDRSTRVKRVSFPVERR